MKTDGIFVFLICMVIVGISPAHGLIVHVPGDLPDIESAIYLAGFGDTILLAPGTYTGEQNKGLDFKGKEITLTSETGYEYCVLDCQNSDRALYLHSGESPNTVISGITIRNGRVGDNSLGGGIHCENSSPTILNCRFENNTADSGGALYFRDSESIVDGCNFSCNTAFDGSGGAIMGFFGSDLQFSNCIFGGNSAEEDGGAVSCHVQSRTFISCEFTENSCGRNGGAVFLEQYSGTITGCQFTENCSGISEDYFGMGGALYLEDCGTSAQIIRNDFHGNRAACGGAIFIYDAPPTMGGSEGNGNDFADNFAGFGADIFAYTVPVTPINAMYNAFSGNSESEFYIAPQSAFDVSNCINSTPLIDQDLYVSPDGSDMNDGLTPGSPLRTLRHAMGMIKLTPTEPGIIHMASGLYSPSGSGEQFPLPLLSNLSVTSDQSYPAATLNAEQTATIFISMHSQQVRIEGLALVNGMGGSSGFIPGTITHTFPAGGGAIYGSYGEVSAVNCGFSNNRADSGGAIHLWYSSLGLDHCSFNQNQSRFGGAIFISSTDFDIDNCVFTHNQSTASGGAGYLNYLTTARITNCRFSMNGADGDGGALMVANQSNADIYNCAFYQNSSSDRGAAIGIDESGCTLYNTSVVDQFSGWEAIFVKSADLMMNYCISWNPGLFEIYETDNEGLRNVTVRYSDIEAGYPGEGNFDSDPLFVSGDEYFLSHIATGQSEDSPCIDVADIMAENAFYPSISGDFSMGDFTTRTDLTVDTGILDIGFHYSPDTTPPTATPTPGITPTMTATSEPSVTLTPTPTPEPTGTGAATPGIFHVPQDYSTIQAAINAASNGSTVIISDGTYSGSGNKILDFIGKNITVTSEHGAEQTVIECGQFGNAFYFHSGETQAAVVSHLTIRNGNMNLGGGISIFSAHPSIISCIFNNCSADSGGGVYVEAGAVFMQDCAVLDNSSYQWGGAMAFRGTDMQSHVQNCIFESNTSTSGGAIYGYESQINVEDCIFNVNMAGGGGAIFLSYSASDITDCVFSGNSASIGGAFYGEITGTTHISSSIFQANQAETRGGAIYIHSGLTIDHSRFLENLADEGGAIYTRGSPSLYACEFTDNSANSDGGAFSGYTSNSKIISCFFSGNSGLRGGAIRSSGELYGINLVNCLINNNSAVIGGGVSASNQLKMSNCTVMDNTATQRTGGLDLSGSWINEIRSCIFWNDTPDEIYTNEGSNIRYCDIQGGYTGTGNIDADPLFMIGPEGLFYLSHVDAGQTANSPCIDTGRYQSNADSNCFEFDSMQTCMDALTTRTDEITDSGTVDMGYHYITHTGITPTPTSTETKTPTPAVTATRTPLIEPTSTPEFTSTPEPSPSCTPQAFSGVQLELSSNQFTAGDQFQLVALCCGDPEDGQVELYVILDISGLLLFYPHWSENIDSKGLDLTVGLVSRETIFDFEWPEGNFGSCNGIRIWGAILSPGDHQLIGDYDLVEFGYYS